MTRRIIFIFVLVLFVTTTDVRANAHCSCNSKVLFDAAVKDIDSNSILNKNYLWVSESFEECYQIERDFQKIADLVEMPLGCDSFSLGKWMVSELAEQIFKYSSTREYLMSDRKLQENLYYKRLLFKRYCFLFRHVMKIFGFDEYPLPLKSSRFREKYDKYADEWASAVDSLEKLKRTGAEAAEIRKAEQNVERCRTLWDKRGYRQLLTVIKERYRMNSITPQSIKGLASKKFETYNLEKTLEQSALRFEFSEKPQNLLWRQIPKIGEDVNTGYEYAILGITRPWLDLGLIFFRDWYIPESRSIRLLEVWSDSDCNSASPISCIVERLVVVRSLLSEKSNEIFAVGVIGEKLPILPKKWTGLPLDEFVSSYYIDSRGDLVCRLRDGTF